jgi:hypothetical protein
MAPLRAQIMPPKSAQSAFADKGHGEADRITDLAEAGDHPEVVELNVPGGSAATQL